MSDDDEVTATDSGLERSNGHTPPLDASAANGNAGAAVATAPPPAEAPPEPPVAEAAYGSDIGTFHAFRYRDYRFLWAGNAFSSAAQWIQLTTMGWVAYDLTGSGSLVGAIGSVGNLGTPLIAPIAGVASDRISRSLIVAASQFLLFVNAIVLAVIISMGALEVWHLFAFAICAGVFNAVNMPARQTLVFDVVPRSVIPNAVALSNLAFSTMRTVGPMVGGALITLFGPSNNFLVQAVAYLGVMGTALMIRPPKQPAVSRAGRSFFKDMAEGYGWALHNPQARILLLMLTIYPTFIIPLHNALMPIFAKSIFHEGAEALGILLGSLGLGGIIGGLIAASLNRVDRRGMLQLYAIFLCSISQAVFSIVAGSGGGMWAGAFCLVVAGIGGSIFNATNQTVVQLVAPDHLRGRITSVLQVQPLCMAIGTLAAGALADVIGAPAVGTILSLTAFTIAFGVLVFSPRVRDMRLSQLGAAGRGQ